MSAPHPAMVATLDQLAVPLVPMVSALTGLPLCERCSDPIEPGEEALGELVHRECAEPVEVPL